MHLTVEEYQTVCSLLLPFCAFDENSISCWLSHINSHHVAYSTKMYQEIPQGVWEKCPLCIKCLSSYFSWQSFYPSSAEAAELSAALKCYLSSSFTLSVKFFMKGVKLPLKGCNVDPSKLLSLFGQVRSGLYVLSANHILKIFGSWRPPQQVSIHLIEFIKADRNFTHSAISEPWKRVKGRKKLLLYTQFCSWLEGKKVLILPCWCLKTLLYKITSLHEVKALQKNVKER